MTSNDVKNSGQARQCKVLMTSRLWIDLARLLLWKFGHPSLKLFYLAWYYRFLINLGSNLIFTLLCSLVVL